jgi:hypothetical protein
MDATKHAALCPKDAVTLVTLTRRAFFSEANKFRRVSVTKDEAAMYRVTVVIAVMLMNTPVAAAEPSHETIAAWNAYIARASDRPARPGSAPRGEMIDIPGGTIYHSSGSMLIRRTTVDRVIRALMYPGTPPPQEDVLDARVLARTDSTLRVYLKLARTAVVTVVYDTEHQVTFTRHSPAMATSRSVSTRIQEVDGGDRGFLWRLNSYWRYTQVGNDVRVDLESLSLSRGVPRVARAVARPIIDRIARESLIRTLDSVHRFLEARA